MSSSHLTWPGCCFRERVDDDVVCKDLRHGGSNEDAHVWLFSCLGDEGADRMEFYINHLTAMEGCDANNIAAALMSDAGVEDPSSTQNVVYRPPFPLLETIAEETMEDLMLDLSDSSSASALDESSESPSSNSGRWGWGWGWLNTSDDDSSSVIHVPVSGGSPAAIPSGSLVHHHSELTDINSGKLAPIWRLLLPLVCFFNGFPVNRNLSSGWTRFGL